MNRKNFMCLKEKRKIFLFLFGFCLFLIINLNLNYGTSHPGENSSSTYHDQGNYSISVIQGIFFTVEKGENITLTINATGTSPIIRYHLDSDDNQYFRSISGTYFPDNSSRDLDPRGDFVLVNITLTSPQTEGNYTLLFFAQSPTGNPPQIAYIEVEIMVEKPHFRIETLWNEFYEHLNMYLGTIALICVITGTILYETDHTRTKSHAILTTTGLILTTINIIQIIPDSISILQLFNPNIINDWFHLIHILLGIIGYVFGIIALFAGLAGIRTKKPGYIALLLWTINYFSGILIWGVNF